MIFVNKTWQSIIMKSIITVFFQSLPIIEYFKVTALTTPKCKYFLFSKKNSLPKPRNMVHNFFSVYKVNSSDSDDFADMNP